MGTYPNFTHVYLFKPVLIIQTDCTVNLVWLLLWLPKSNKTEKRFLYHWLRNECYNTMGVAWEGRTNSSHQINSNFIRLFLIYLTNLVLYISFSLLFRYYNNRSLYPSNNCFIKKQNCEIYKRLNKSVSMSFFLYWYPFRLKKPLCRQGHHVLDCTTEANHDAST